MDDDPAADWGEDEPTALDAVPELDQGPTTAPHDLAALAARVEVTTAREEGCRACYGEGQEDAISAFMLVFREHGLTTEEIAHTVAAARAKLTRL